MRLKHERLELDALSFALPLCVLKTAIQIHIPLQNCGRGRRSRDHQIVPQGVGDCEVDRKRDTSWLGIFEEGSLCFPGE